MNRTVYILLLFLTYSLHGQEQVVKIPERVIIVNDEIVTMEKVTEYEKQGYIKAMHNGVSDERRADLFAKFGDKIGPKEFIMEIFLRTEEEEQIQDKISQKDIATFLKVNDNIKDFTVKMINQESITLSDLKGKVVLLNFWATWCAPCIREFYAFPSVIIEPFKNSEFVLLPISVGELEGKVNGKMDELKKNGVDFNVGIDPKQSIYYLYTQGSLPLNYLIDKNGVIRYISKGYNKDNLDNISTKIKKLLDE